MSSCIFCAIAEGRAPAEFLVQEEDALAFLDIHPQSPGHTLIVPRRHIGSLFECTPEDGAVLMRLAVRLAHVLRKTLQPDGLRLLSNSGRAAGQDVMHLHLHLIPRWRGRPAVAGGVDLRSASRAEIARLIRAGWP